MTRSREDTINNILAAIAQQDDLPAEFSFEQLACAYRKTHTASVSRRTIENLTRELVSRGVLIRTEGGGRGIPARFTEARTKPTKH